LLCIAGEPAALSTRMDRLIVARGEKVLYDLPWRHVRAVILFGPHTVTVPAMNVALQRGVPLHFAGRVGAYRGVLWNGRPGAAGAALWLRQASLFADPALALSLAKQIVAVRIRHQRETLRRRGVSQAAEMLERRLESVERAADLSALNGCEGAAAKDYFQALAALLGAEWGFDGRNRRPPLDPFNALLSLGYTLLHGYAETLLHADGLLPWLGFYHQAHGAHATLASDLMEPFRHLIERAALAVAQRRELHPGDFFKQADGACHLRPDARRLYLARVLERLDAPVTALGETEARTPLQHLHRQNLSLVQWLTKGEPFRVWRVR
jgi:CRISPR-associated endonuclease Cas1